MTVILGPFFFINFNEMSRLVTHASNVYTTIAIAFKSIRILNNYNDFEIYCIKHGK